jgi:hypothetical protein
LRGKTSFLDASMDRDYQIDPLSLAIEKRILLSLEQAKKTPIINPYR